MWETLLAVPHTFWNEFWWLWAILLALAAGLMLLVTRLLTGWGYYQKIKQDWWKKLPIEAARNTERVHQLGDKVPANLQRFVAAYHLAGLRWPWRSYLYALVGFAAMMTLFFLLSGRFVAGFLAGPMAVFFGSGIIFLKAEDQKKRLVEQIPVFLQALANALQANYTLQSAFSFIADELDEPLKTQVQQVNQKLQLQVPLPIALQEWAESMHNSEINFLVESTLIQLETGGNLVVLFQRTAHLLEEKQKLKRDIKSFTSQGKMSGILIAALWPVSLLGFSYLSPQHTAVLFDTPAGNLLLALSLGLEVMGFLCIWRIVKVKI